MSYSVTWNSKVVNIPLTDLISVGAGEYNLDLEDFHDEIRRLEWEFNEGLFAEQILDYTKPKTISGTTLAGVVEIVNGYTFVFPIGALAVNLVGANTNLGELQITPANGVSIRPQNSAGNTITISGSGVTEQDKLDIADRVWDEQTSEHVQSGSMGKELVSEFSEQVLYCKQVAAPVGSGDGTEGFPFDDWPVCYAYSQSVGIRKILIVGDRSISVLAEDVDGYTFRAIGFLAVLFFNPASAAIVFMDRCGLINTSQDIIIIGEGINSAGGTIPISTKDGWFSGGLNLPNFGSLQVHRDPTILSNGAVLDCSSLVGALTFVAMAGDVLTLTNISEASASVSLNLAGASVVLDSSCIAGSITLSGTGSLVDNSVGLIVIDKRVELIPAKSRDVLLGTTSFP